MADIQIPLALKHDVDRAYARWTREGGHGGGWLEGPANNPSSELGRRYDNAMRGLYGVPEEFLDFMREHSIPFEEFNVKRE